jgi:Transposase DDE domain
MKRAGLAATIKARWICEQAHQQLKEKLGLDHFEGRSWQGLHRHALMTIIAYAFLQHRHLTQVGRKKESTDRRLSLACRPYATPSSISFFDHYLSNAHTAEDEAVKNSGVGKSAKVVLVAPDDIYSLLFAAFPDNRYGLLGTLGHICSFRRYDGRRISVCPIPGNIICIRVMHFA